MTESGNKRSFYRVNDRALLKVRVLDTAERDELIEQFEQRRMHYSLTTHVSHQRQQRMPLISSIRKKHPDIASYLDHLEAQLDTLAGQLVQQLDFGEDARPQPINLSATGLRYESEVAVESGASLEIGLLLQPDQQLVLALGTAVRVEAPASDDDDQGQSWSVSVGFDCISEEDQELLIKHVHRIQRIEFQSARRAGGAD